MCSNQTEVKTKSQFKVKSISRTYLKKLRSNIEASDVSSDHPTEEEISKIKDTKE